ncbi:hypothetical protein ABFT23_16680 [Nocardioides sp. C4-1]|uniref:hypothetical protein n=1 Tax=Nocardioides sp. C4-1 TaxID=3151851 RepID=UPI00326511F6
MGAALAAAVACLVGPGTSPASAESKTFEPAKPRPYLESVTVASTPKAWRFTIRTKQPQRVIGYEIYLDFGPSGRDPGASADYILQSVLGTTRLYQTFDGTRQVSRPANCAGKKSVRLKGAAGPGRRFVIPQSCLREFDAVAGTTGGPVGRLRARVAVIAQPPEGNCVYSWSPKRGRSVFHGWVRNDLPPAAVEPPARTRGASIPTSAPARRGC